MPKRSLDQVQVIQHDDDEEETEGDETREKKTKSSVGYTYEHKDGAVELHTNCFDCLNSGSYFKDTIVEFYFRYLLNEFCEKSVISRVHIFDTIFYNQLDLIFNAPSSWDTEKSKSEESQSEQETQKKDPKPKSGAQKEKRIINERWPTLKKWFTGIDVFQKDFLIIPVCENNHWRAIVVCYPAEVKPVFGDSLDSTSQTSTASKTNGTPSKTNGTPTKTNSASTRANGTSTATDGKNSNNEVTVLPRRKVPSIIVLDSLGLKNRSVTWKIRSFLDYEWRLGDTDRKEIKRFAQVDLKDYHPAVPRQKNAYDCGLYMLMYIRCFLEKPDLFYKLTKRNDGDSIKTLRLNIRKCLAENDRESLKQLIQKVCVKHAPQT